MKLWRPTSTWYAGIEHKRDGGLVYIGGRHYQDVAQIHLTIEEAKELRNWLNRRFPKPRKKK